ncbi:MAG: hypothetical protein RIS78_1034 [Bacteroidota bacterium]|jgi:hypothetical protein|nr:DUF1566 domain-containing protein [Bacteroidota bacterium]NBW42907.1 DUF1566 domain-containing protein [Sphingobacteriia bacterium]
MKFAILLVGLMGLIGLSETALAQKPWSKTSKGYTVLVKGNTIRVADEDFPKTMSWDNALAAVAALGDGKWRLPTMEELRAIYQQLYVQDEGSFKTAAYYTGVEVTAANAWAMNFEMGNVYNCFKGNTLNVRVVRDN